MVKKVREFNLLLRRKPHLLILFLSTCAIATQLGINFYRQEPLFTNFESIIYFLWPFFSTYLVSLVTHKKVWIFILCFTLNFIALLIQSYFDKSFVDYTSAILFAILAIFCAGLSLAIAWMYFPEVVRSGNSSANN